MENLDDFINHMFPPVEDKPGYVWINKRNHEMAKVDLIKDKLRDLHEQYRILQEKLKFKPVTPLEDHISSYKGLQADMVTIDEFLTEEDKDGN